MIFYVGTLTRLGGRGILCCALTPDGIRCLSEYPAVADPIWLARSADGKRLFSVCTQAGTDGFSGRTAEFAVEEDGLLPLAQYSTGGDGPCHLTLSPDGRFLYAANYGSGSLAVLPAEPHLGPACQTLSFSGSGPDPVRQEGSHLHQTIFVPDTQTLIAADLGADALYLFHADADTGRLTQTGRIALSGGPRHLAFLPGGRACLVHELSNEITLLERTDDTFVPVQTLSTLPPACAGSSLAAAIRVSPDGRTVFVSNRGMGSIAVFTLGCDGRLSVQGHLPAGIFPRDFLLLPNGSFLVADQDFGLRLVDRSGRQIASLPHPGAVCVLA